MNSLPRMVTVTPSRDSFTSAALQGLEPVDHGFDARAGEPRFFDQARVLLVQVAAFRLERLVLAFQPPAGIDQLVDAAFQDLEILAFQTRIVAGHNKTIGPTPAPVNAFEPNPAVLHFAFPPQPVAFRESKAIAPWISPPAFPRSMTPS